MKKGLLIGLLVCAILASVITGTLAVYQSSIDEMSGDVVAKAFVFTKAGEFEGDYQTPKIAPGEEVRYIYSVSNFDKDIVTEVDTDVEMWIQLKGLTTKNQMYRPLPLKVKIDEVVTIDGVASASRTLIDFDNKKINNIDVTNDGYKKGVGTVVLPKVFEANKKTTVTYTVTLKWFGDTATDASHMDDKSQLSITGMATQKTK